MTTSLQQARQACIAAQTQVNALTDALANASQQLLNVYKGFGKNPNDHETFILKINQQYPSIQNLTIPIEQQYQDAYVALQEANDKLQIAQTLVDQSQAIKTTMYFKQSNLFVILYRQSSSKWKKAYLS